MTVTNRTMILVAHRLSTLLTTDRILLIDEGAVAESGTYNELVEQGGTVRGTGRERGIGDPYPERHFCDRAIYYYRAAVSRTSFSGISNSMWGPMQIHRRGFVGSLSISASAFLKAFNA